MKKINAIDLYMCRRDIMRRICPRCGGKGRFDSGETCYYCKGYGSVD